MTPRYYRKMDDQKIQCELCPHHCIIRKQKSGLCRVRSNNDGTMELPFYGKISALGLDPIEKKPLYHYHPGKMILSVGFWGCNFRCPFCQNHRISQNVEKSSDYLSPQDLVRVAIKKDSFAIAYTYSEPLVHWEYIYDTAKLAHQKGLKNVLVSNGHIEKTPAEELLNYLDAANIDLKGFNQDFYDKEIKGNLEAVKEFISLAAQKLSLEVTTLVIPGKNDSPEEIMAIAAFLASLKKNLAYHLSAYYPTYKYDIPATQTQSLLKLGEVARQKLSYVYLGNIGFANNSTLCRECGNVLVWRKGYQVSLSGIDKGLCSKCGHPSPLMVS